MTVIEAIKRAQRTAPVDVMGLAGDLGVRVNVMRLDEDVSGELKRVSGDVFEINVNALHPPTRQRFTIAHELGHYLYHRELIGEGVDDNKAYRRSDGHRFPSTRIGAREESDANRFAANLLMPFDLIARLRAEGLNRAQMARRLEVSEQALAIRTGEPYP
ncbi:MAG: ImmA/IrrE family metallo-endopeptidase [Caulobacter sp.]|nr:ImmA/IrrE family metallo-endopeptidase [Caulobacter sp.]